MSKLPIDKETSVAWLKHGDSKWETESLIVSAQDQALRTQFRRYKISPNESCRLCEKNIETVVHIMTLVLN